MIQALFCKWNSLNIEQSRFVKKKVDAKADYYYKSLTKVYWTAGNSNAFQTYNSSLLQILDKSVNPVEQAAYNNDVRYAFNDVF
jgi:hypothetical protein